MKQHPSWFKQRRYLHFDTPVGMARSLAYVSDPQRVAQHAFYPFITLNSKTIKVSKNDQGMLVKKKKDRPLAYAAHLDSHIYAFYTQLLSDLYEDFLKAKSLSNTILAFRKLGKSNIEFAGDAFNIIRKMGDCDVLTMDITGFFDHLDHALLKQRWMQLLNVKKLPQDHFNIFKSLTQFAQVERTALYEELGLSANNPPKNQYRVCSVADFRDKVRRGGLITRNDQAFGIPQGSPISALLSNIYMAEFDETINRQITFLGGVYFRYCDDMLFILPKGHVNELKKAVVSQLSLLKLEIQPQKTKSHIFESIEGRIRADTPLQYLGFEFDGERSYLRSSSLSRYYARQKRAVSLAKQTMWKYNKIRKNKGLPKESLYKRKLYNRFSHVGKRNFITYGLRAAKILNSDSIRKQLRSHMTKLQNEMKKY